MSRRDWRCRSRICTVPGGGVLGRITVDGDSLVLALGVAITGVYFDAGRAEIACPACGAVRDFRGRMIRTHAT